MDYIHPFRIFAGPILPFRILDNSMIILEYFNNFQGFDE